MTWCSLLDDIPLTRCDMDSFPPQRELMIDSALLINSCDTESMATCGEPTRVCPELTRGRLRHLICSDERQRGLARQPHLRRPEQNKEAFAQLKQRYKAA